ncbi:MAG: SDR family oxidoreductase [Acidobacteria bacterium]|nr:SDR family oxidoreductase [Acidobacteriota bacterium]
MDFVEKYGRYALITGASAGIGKEFAYILAEKGRNLILVARREDKLKEIASDITERYKIECVTAKNDLTLENSYKDIFDFTKSYDIGLLVNNAGFGYYGRFINQKEDKLKDMIKLNVLTFSMLTRVFGEYFLKRGKGGIILVSSLAAFQPTAGMAQYGATKGFELLLGEALSEEIKGKNVDITILCPGATVTEFQIAAEGVPHNGMDAREVAVGAGNNLDRKLISIPGIENKIVGKLHRFLPRSFVRWATKKALSHYLKD